MDNNVEQKEQQVNIPKHIFDECEQMEEDIHFEITKMALYALVIFFIGVIGLFAGMMVIFGSSFLK